MTPAQALARLLVEVTDAAIAGCNASNGATLPVDLRVIGHVITMSADVVRWVNHDAGDTLFRWDHATRAETSGPLAPWRARLVALLAEAEPMPASVRCSPNCDHEGGVGCVYRPATDRARLTRG